MKKIRIGSGAGYAGDRIEPAVSLLESGELHYIGFECLAERTIALAQKQRLQDPSKGYNHLLEYRMEKILPLAYKNKVKVITNMGAANPEGAMKVIAEMAGKMGLKGMKIAAVLGDNLYPQIAKYQDFPIIESGHRLSSLGKNIISANAYLGINPILEALKEQADIIITGRVADPSLFLAPLVHEFGWSLADSEKLGKGTLIGHLLECAGQISGGYFAEPGKKEVPDLWNLGFPFIEVDESGNGIISKVPGTGGVINTATCTEQMLYEIHDPARYLTPDCTADFSRVTFHSVGENQVSFQGADGFSASDTYKVSVGYRNGFSGKGEISYGGQNCREKALLASEIIKQRLGQLKLAIEDLRIDLIGINSLFPGSTPSTKLNEVRLRVEGRTKTKAEAGIIANEVEALYTNGPAGGGGATKQLEELVSVASILVPKTDIQTKLIYQKIK